MPVVAGECFDVRVPGTRRGRARGCDVPWARPLDLPGRLRAVSRGHHRVRKGRVIRPVSWIIDTLEGLANFCEQHMDDNHYTGYETYEKFSGEFLTRKGCEDGNLST